MISISIIVLFLKITRTKKVIGAVPVYFIRYLQALITIVIITKYRKQKQREKKQYVKDVFGPLLGTEEGGGKKGGGEE